MQTFDEAYTRLNPEQKRAVETTEGPVLVIAGPGTGKTQVLTLRIAHILQKTDTLPENILALTFTDNAAQNMRERLIEFIGVTAYRIKITTFHSFANDIIQSFPEKFAFRKELEQIDDLQKFTIFSELLTSYDPSSTYKQFPEGESIAKELYGNNPQALKPFNAPELYTNEILQKIDRLKREFVSKEKFASLIRDELDTFKTQEKINPRTKKPYGAWTSQAKVIVKNIELLHFYTEYKKKMDERGLYDFGDMIANVAESLQNDDEVLAHFQERFLYILLDEFQDTNGAQNAIVTALGSWDSKPNIFAVGDDDQSIFRFQGANLANILEFTNQYPDAQIITLKTNYRSYQEILDAADTVIQNNSERLGDQIESVSKKLTAFQENGGSISLGNFSKQELEYHYIAEKISTLLKEGIDPNEIAVIYHKHKDGEEIRAVFEKHTIPLEIVVSENIV
ncbi:UvrD-helicase domain-containing protein, partial [Candidatus Dojkabacteria bacterium]|nr:UvrD-helicase domain-containing protein [Candidatus Dojkabacteria bacterium]